MSSDASGSTLMGEQRLRLLIIGPPGAGKGTQAARITTHFDVPWVSTGDIFRQNIASDTLLGRRVAKVIEAGQLVSDELTTEVVTKRLIEIGTRSGFLLDGYPRTISQALSLEEFLRQQEGQLDAVVLLEVDTEVVVTRLLQRAQLFGRADDTEAVIRHRQEVYAEQTKPLLAMYRERGVLLAVDGLGEVDEVTGRIYSALNARLSLAADAV